VQVPFVCEKQTQKCQSKGGMRGRRRDGEQPLKPWGSTFWGETKSGQDYCPERREKDFMVWNVKEGEKLGLSMIQTDRTKVSIQSRST